MLQSTTAESKSRVDDAVYKNSKCFLKRIKIVTTVKMLQIKPAFPDKIPPGAHPQIPSLESVNQDSSDFSFLWLDIKWDI